MTHISSKEVLKNHMTNAGQDDELSNHEVPRGESVSNEVVNKLISEAVNETVEISNVRYRNLNLLSHSINTINVK